MVPFVRICPLNARLAVTVINLPERYMTRTPLNTEAALRLSWSQNFAHPNRETVDSLFAIIHSGIEINPSLPFFPSITRELEKSYVFEQLFLSGEETVEAERPLKPAFTSLLTPHEIIPSVGWRTES